MQRTTLRKAAGAALPLLLVASLVANIVLYRQASRTLVEERHRPLVERTVAHFARSEGRSADDIRAESFPIAMRQGDRTCIELRRYDGLGHSGACYDRGERMIEETGSVSG